MSADTRPDPDQRPPGLYDLHVAHESFTRKPSHPSVLDIVCECLQLIQELPTERERVAAIEVLFNIKCHARAVLSPRSP